MGEGGEGKGGAAASSSSAPAGVADVGQDDNPNPWLVRAAKRQQQGAGILFGHDGDISSDAAMAIEFAQADRIKEAQVVSFTGGRARSPSLFAGKRQQPPGPAVPHWEESCSCGDRCEA